MSLFHHHQTRNSTDMPTVKITLALIQARNLQAKDSNGLSGRGWGRVCGMVY